jgi:hypothetical protein
MLVVTPAKDHQVVRPAPPRTLCIYSVAPNRPDSLFGPFMYYIVYAILAYICLLFLRLAAFTLFRPEFLYIYRLISRKG